jgi:N-acetyl-anhydromuramyl-L-alanine amidase AmpD
VSAQLPDRRQTTAHGLDVHDVRRLMPNYAAYCDVRRDGAITGIAIHHSATANAITGVSMDDAASIFRYQVETRGWSHGGYHYLVHPNGVVEYALDERVPAFHAGFTDPDDRLGLERGQYWNNHLLAVCLLGWFEHDRVRADGTRIPNRFTKPTPGQWRALVALLRDLTRRHAIDIDAIVGHRDLRGCRTACPGANVDLDTLRSAMHEPMDTAR